MIGKRTLAAVLAALLIFASAAQAEGYWTSLPKGNPSCKESRPGCYLLQMVMAGTFTDLDPQDSISVRVYSAVLPRLLSLPEEDFTHFCEQFSVETESIRRAYYIALGNCLLAEIEQGGLRTTEEAAAHRVLQLFLYPEGEKNAEAQKASIRAQMNGDILATMAESTGLPADFITYVIETEGWNQFPAE